VTAALYRGERGMKVMANGVDTLVDGLQAAAAIFTLFTPMGKALSIGSKLLINGVAAAAKGVSSLNKLNAEQSDKLYKVYQDLSNVGAAGAGGLEKLFDTMQQAGFTAAELDQFSAAIKRNAQDLSMFGATTAQGAEALAKMSGGLIKGDLGLALMNLGYNAESLANSTAAYLTLQNRLGNIQTKTAMQLQKEAGAYAFELDKLTRLTGLSREDQEKRQQSLMSDERYAGFIATAGRTQGYDVKNLEMFFNMFKDEGTRKGLQHMLASGGAATSPEAIKIQQSDPMAYQRMMEVARGGSAAGAAVGFYGQANRYMTGVGGQTARYTGTGPGISLSGNLAESERFIQMEASARKAGAKSLDDYVKSEQDKVKADQGEQKRQNETRLQQMGAAQALDSTVKKFTLLNSLTDTLNSAFSSLATTLGGKVAGGAPTSGKGGTAFAGNQKEFYEKMYGTLLDQATKAGVANPEAIARLGAAQSALETGYGKSTAAGNNYFGIKAKAGDPNASNVNTQEWDPVSGKMVTQKAGFRKYGSMEESAADYIKFLQENQRYRSVLSANSAAEAIAAQGRTGYATDPSYAQKLQSIHASGSQIGGAGGFGGMLSGPMSGYRPNILMHGTEELSIRPMGRTSDSSSGDGGGMSELVSEISELVSISRRQLYTAQKILQHQQ